MEVPFRVSFVSTVSPRNVLTSYSCVCPRLFIPFRISCVGFTQVFGMALKRYVFVFSKTMSLILPLNLVNDRNNVRFESVDLGRIERSSINYR